LGPFLGLLLFFLLYRDIYYLYFQTLMPFLVLAATAFLGWVWSSHKNGPAYSLMLIAVYILFIVLSIAFYRQNWLAQGNFSNADQVAAAVAKLPEPYPIYGDYTAATLVSVLSGRQIFRNNIDTNLTWFRNGRLDKEDISAQAVKGGVYLVARVTDAPELGIKDAGFEEYFSPDLFKASCKQVLDFPDLSGNAYSRLAVYECKD